MSKARYIRDEIWDDTWVFSLPMEKKIAWLYLLTNPQCNVAGVYKLNRFTAAAAIGTSKENFDTLLNDFSDAEKVLLHEDWIFIVNFHKHQTKSPKVMAGIKRILEELPRGMQEVLIGYEGISKEYHTLLNLTLLNSTLPNGKIPSDLEGFFEEAKYSEEDMRLAQLLADLIKGNNPDWHLKGNIETWAEHVEKLRRIDKRTPEQIEYMIRWTQGHDFWQANILSTAKLRQKFDDLIPKVKQDAVSKHRQRVSASKPKMI